MQKVVQCPGQLEVGAAMKNRVIKNRIMQALLKLDKADVHTGGKRVWGSYY